MSDEQVSVEDLAIHPREVWDALDEVPEHQREAMRIEWEAQDSGSYIEPTKAALTQFDEGCALCGGPFDFAATYGPGWTHPTCRARERIAEGRPLPGDVAHINEEETP